MASNLRNLLNFLMESSNVDEAAVEPDQMVKKKLALYIAPPDQLANLFLYSPVLFQESIHQEEGTDAQGKAIIGAIALGQNSSCNAWEVTLSGAKKGYGPFLYQASSATLGWIMSDRGDISTQAENVWKWMYNHPDQWDRQSLEDAEDSCWQLDYDEETLGDEAKNHFLNFKYLWKGGEGITANLVEAHKKTVEHLSNSTGLTKDDVEFLLLEEAEAYLHN